MKFCKYILRYIFFKPLSPLVVGDDDALLNPYETGLELPVTAFVAIFYFYGFVKFMSIKWLLFTVVKLVFRVVKNRQTNESL